MLLTDKYFYTQLNMKEVSGVARPREQAGVESRAAHSEHPGRQGSTGPAHPEPHWVSSLFGFRRCGLGSERGSNFELNYLSKDTIFKWQHPQRQR